MQEGARCFLLTKKDVLMPGTFLGVSYAGGIETYDVESPGGKIYSCSPNNVFDFCTGRAMMIHRRAEQLALEGYQISLRADGTYRVWCEAKHGKDGGWIVSEPYPGMLVCNCPAHEPGEDEDREPGCKHSYAVADLLYRKAAEAQANGQERHAETYQEIASRIAFAPELHEQLEREQRRERVLASINQDF